MEIATANWATKRPNRTASLQRLFSHGADLLKPWGQASKRQCRRARGLCISEGSPRSRPQQSKDASAPPTAYELLALFTKVSDPKGALRPMKRPSQQPTWNERSPPSHPDSLTDSAAENSPKQHLASPVPSAVTGVVVIIRVWVKNRYPKWNPGKWKQGLKPTGGPIVIHTHHFSVSSSSSVRHFVYRGDLGALASVAPNWVHRADSTSPSYYQCCNMTLDMIFRPFLVRACSMYFRVVPLSGMPSTYCSCPCECISIHFAIDSLTCHGHS